MSRRRIIGDPRKGWGRRLVVVGVVLAAGLFWATRTQDVVGTPERSWSHTATLQRFVPLSTGGWQTSLTERPPEMPVEGTGGEGGVQNVRACEEKQNGTRRVADGTERVCRDQQRKVQDGTREACVAKDLGNGFTEEACTDEPVYRTETVEKCTDEIRYREEPVLDTWCTYDTWAWKTLDAETLSGTWDAPRWPAVRPGPLDRVQRSHTYAVQIHYPHRDGTETHPVTPKTLAELDSWTEGQTVSLEVNNLGEVVAVAR